MNANVQEPENNEMEMISGALTTFDRVGAGLALLEKNFKGMLYDVETTMGMEHAKAARAAIRDPRYEVERVRKSAKAPLLALGKRLDAEASRITTALLALETPIDEQIKFREKQLEDDRRAREVAELKRVADLHERVAELRGNPSLSSNDSPARILEHIADLERIAVDDSFQELRQQAEDAKAGGLARLRAIHTAAVEREAEQARIKAEREELASLRAEQAERDRLAAAERAKQEAADKADREAKAKEDAEIRAKQAAEAKAQRDAEAAKLKAEREENDRIARERKQELDRQEEEANARRQAEERCLAAEREEIAREKVALAEAQKVNEVSPRQESTPTLPALSQAVPDPKEAPQDQGTSPDDAPTVEIGALDDTTEVSGILLAVLLSRARYFVRNYQCSNDDEESTRSELLDEINDALGVEAASPAAVSNGSHEDWDDDLPF